MSEAPEKIPETQPAHNKSVKVKRWARRGGLVVFLFFLLKGIGWLVFFALAYFGFVEFSGCN